MLKCQTITLLYIVLTHMRYKTTLNYKYIRSLPSNHPVSELPSPKENISAELRLLHLFFVPSYLVGCSL